MAKKHLFLNNRKNQNNGFRRQRNINSEKIIDVASERKIDQFQIAQFRDFYTKFNQSYNERYENRTIEFPDYIDLIEIQFFPIFNSDLKKKFIQNYGLSPVFYKDFNRTVIFEVENSDLFSVFKSHIEYIISQVGAIAYSGEEFNLIANIYKFKFIDKRSKTSDNKDVILSTIQSVSFESAQIQKESLNQLLIEENISFSTNDAEDLYYLSETSEGLVEKIEVNFDIVQTITSSRALNIRPGMFGILRTDYGFEAVISDNLPVVGIIDTGVNAIPPFKNLVEKGINLTKETSADHSGHGTLVAGLTIFGTDLPSLVKDSYKAKCKVLPIKVLHSGNDGVDFPKLLDAIRQANKDKGVRLFNMSLAFAPKQYNEAFSNFAYELDCLSYELGVLIFISVGNFNDTSLMELLTDDYHKDHDYPDFFYKLDSDSSIHKCENTNICTPSDSLNNLSIGALAGNLESKDNSDITPLNIYPAYYSRKFHFDYEQKINTTKFGRSQKNKHLNKPDLLFDGGDFGKEESGIEVLVNEGQFYSRSAGTSLSTPIITSMAAEIMSMYPELDVQSIKALLINSASYYKSRVLPHFKSKQRLLKKLIGFGIPEKSKTTQSDKNSITMIIEDQIQPMEIISLPIFLPEYLRVSKNKLIFDISIAYSFLPDKGNHLGYLPLHISYNLLKNLEIKEISEKTADVIGIKDNFSWSEDHFGKENILFSNAQKKEYRLQPDDIISLDGELAISVRCLIKEDIDETLRDRLKSEKHPFSLVIRITEELKNETEHELYSEMQAINNLTVIGEIDTKADLDLDN